MHVRNLLFVVAACGGGKPATRDDAAVSRDSAGSGTGTPTQTEVTGAIGGSAFDLRYAAVSWGPQGDPRIWVCVANVPITYSQCMQSGGADRIMLLGPFTYDQSGAPRWDVAELFLYRVGTSPMTELARSGTITVFEDNSASNSLKLSFSVNFGDAQATTGTVVSP